jgi:hypothetical protein
MTDKNAAKPEPLHITDPDNVSITFAHLLVAAGSCGGVVNLTFAAARFSPTDAGTIDNDVIVASRLRLDMTCALHLRAELDRIISQAEVQMKQAMATGLLSSAALGTSGKTN